ncbi:MAG: carbohydrate ABC transporter permease [Candidatus Dormibacteraceae bacterium]
MTLSVAAVSAPERGRRRWTRHGLPFFVFVGPLLIGLTIFTFFPIVWGFLLSFSRGQSSVALGPWVGLQNYESLFSDPAFRDSLATILFFIVVIVPLTFFSALGLACVVNAVRGGRAFFRTVLFIPFAVSYVAASLVWKMGFFNIPSGAVMAFLSLFGVPDISFISTPQPPLYWIVLVSVRLGYYMIIFIVGLQEVPAHLLEAAAVDGARRWTRFWRVTFPMLRNTSVAILILLMVNGFQAFDEFYNIMGGELNGANGALARTPLTYLLAGPLNGQSYGEAAAGSFVLSVMIVIVSIVQARVFGFGRSLD